MTFCNLGNSELPAYSGHRLKKTIATTKSPSKRPQMRQKRFVDIDRWPQPYEHQRKNDPHLFARVRHPRIAER